MCTQCGAALNKVREKRTHSRDGCFEPKVEASCFELPYGGAMAGVIFGILIVIVGITVFLGQSVWSWVWPFLIIVLGCLIIAGVLYGMRRKH
jgi:uncharacterized integral membrane protein